MKTLAEHRGAGSRIRHGRAVRGAVVGVLALVVSLTVAVAAPSPALADGTVHGTVTATDTGLPLGDVSVSVVDRYFGSVRASTTTAGDGTYSVDVPPGEYRVYAHEPSGAHGDRFSGNVATWTASSVVTVTDLGDVVEDFTMAPLPKVHGTVTNDAAAPVEGIQVLLQFFGFTIRSTTTAADGTYSFDSITPASYHLKFVDPGGVYGPTFYVGSNSSKGGQRLNLTHGDDVTADQVVLDKGSISGTATIGSFGAPAAGTVGVLLDDVEFEILGIATANAAGELSFPGLAAGGYRLALVDPANIADPTVGLRPELVGDVDVLTSANFGLDLATVITVTAGSDTDVSESLAGIDCTPGVMEPGVDLSGDDLADTDLRGCSLDGAIIDAVDLSGADLLGASLVATSLVGANLSGTNLTGANVADANIADAVLSATTDLSQTSLLGARNTPVNPGLGIYDTTFCPDGVTATTGDLVATCDGHYVNDPPPAASPANVISVGLVASCAVRTDEVLSCWGRSDAGVTAVPAGSYTAVAVGDNHACGVRTDQTVVCWGDNSSGQAAAPAGSFTAVSAGSYHSCGLRTDQTISCWGSNGNGQIDVPAGTYTSVSAGGFHTCAYRTNGTADCWGFYGMGQGDVPPGSYTAIDAGFAVTCAIRTDTTVSCWGQNDGGVLSAPAGSFSAISAGYHACGIRTDTTAVCWGVNFEGQTDVPAGTYKAISAGFYHTCAIRTDDTVVCWGANGFGQSDPPT